MEGPRVSGPWLVFRGGNAIGVYRPLIYRGACIFFSSVWDYVPTRFNSAGDVDTRRASDVLTDGYDRVDPSPRDHQSNTCAITHLSDVDQKAHRSPRGDRRRAYLHQLKIARSRSNGLL